MSLDTKLGERLSALFLEQPCWKIEPLAGELSYSIPSVRRFLAEVGYCSSFTHNGGWYTLRSIPRFDSDGLWLHPEAPVPTHFELKTVDASSNPYLALGAVIAAGLDGARQGLELPPEVTVDPGTIPDADRSARGIERLPASLGDSIPHLQKDHVLLDALGPELAKAFLAVRRAEWETMKDWSLHMEVRHLLERY